MANAPTHVAVIGRTNPSGRATGTGRPVAIIAVGLLYALIALAAYWPIYPGDPSRLPTCACSDPVQAVWFLRWTAFAVTHGHNPWLTNVIDDPRVVNLAQNTTMPLLGLLGLPLTITAGAVSTFNLFMWLSFPISALACFVLLRRWVRWVPAAFAGGLLYGFSPYMVNQGIGHLNLLFVPFPPIVLLLFDELVVRQHRPPMLVGVGLGLALALEYLVSSELFASTCVMAAIGLLVLAVARPRQIRRRALRVATGLIPGMIVCGALIGYPAAVQLFGPDRFVGSAHGSYPFPADLLGSVVPTRYQLLAPPGAVTTSSRFIMGDTVEDGSYLGVPLIILSASFVVWRWRLGIVRFAGAMATAATVFSLGPDLTIDAHHTGVALPMALLDHLPLVTSFVDARFALYTTLFVAVILAIGADRWRSGRDHVRDDRVADDQVASLRERHRRPRATQTSRRRAVLPTFALVVALVPLLPAWPYPSVPIRIPRFVTGPAVRSIRRGGATLTYPYPTNPTDQAMLWQATSGMWFRLLGGYAVVPGAGRVASYDAFPDHLVSVPATLVADDEGTPLSAVAAGVTPATPAQVRAFVRLYHVTTVLLDPIGAHPSLALSLLTAALGPPVHVGGMDLWRLSRR